MGRVEVLGEGASLQDLCALIDNPDVSEIDLAGRVVETQGCLHIRREGLRVKNGTLAITGGDVKVSSAKGDVSCWVAGVVVDAPNCVLEKVVLRGVQGISIVVNKAPGAVLKVRLSRSARVTFVRQAVE
ncbi:unnamed protein product [Pedinophyceae sp. YPF-701]|nr:unnamed protein product [Pedinophyceae sp. YPF-701]